METDLQFEVLQISMPVFLQTLRCSHLLWLASLAFVLVCGGCEPEMRKPLTGAQYQQLKTGMSLGEVEKITGSRGEEDRVYPGLLIHYAWQIGPRQVILGYYEGGLCQKNPRHLPAKTPKSKQYEFLMGGSNYETAVRLLGGPGRKLDEKRYSWEGTEGTLLAYITDGKLTETTWFPVKK